jgi:hypothetical protein
MTAFPVPCQRIYLAGAQAAYADDVRGRLLLSSYGDKNVTRVMAALEAGGWLIDSGAYTAWSKGRAIDLDGYMSFLDQALGAYPVDGYFALDVIPGRVGGMPTADEVKRAWEASMVNLDRMQARGFAPIPVFHFGADWARLDELIAGGFDVIALGGTVKKPRPAVLAWLDEAFARYPAQKFHGLGCTSEAQLTRIPFWSCDSTSWLTLAMFGVGGNEWLLRGRSSRALRRIGLVAFDDLASNAAPRKPRARRKTVTQLPLAFER